MKMRSSTVVVNQANFSQLVLSNPQFVEKVVGPFGASYTNILEQLGPIIGPKILSNAQVLEDREKKLIYSLLSNHQKQLLLQPIIQEIIECSNEEEFSVRMLNLIGNSSALYQQHLDNQLFKDGNSGTQITIRPILFASADWTNKNIVSAAKFFSKILIKFATTFDLSLFAITPKNRRKIEKLPEPIKALFFENPINSKDPNNNNINYNDIKVPWIQTFITNNSICTQNTIKSKESFFALNNATNNFDNDKFNLPGYQNSQGLALKLLSKFGFATSDETEKQMQMLTLEKTLIKFGVMFLQDDFISLFVDKFEGELLFTGNKKIYNEKIIINNLIRIQTEIVKVAEEQFIKCGSEAASFQTSTSSPIVSKRVNEEIKNDRKKRIIANITASKDRKDKQKSKLAEMQNALEHIGETRVAWLIRSTNRLCDEIDRSLEEDKQNESPVLKRSNSMFCITKDYVGFRFFLDEDLRRKAPVKKFALKDLSDSVKDLDLTTLGLSFS